MNSPHLFGQALASDLLYFSLLNSKVIQKIDNILLWSLSLQISQTNTVVLRNFLFNWGYKILPSEVQLSTAQVTYLNLTFTLTRKTITLGRKNLIQSLEVPFIKENILLFLGILAFLCTWISFLLPLLAFYMTQLLALHVNLSSIPLLNFFRGSKWLISWLQFFISKN